MGKLKGPGEVYETRKGNSICKGPGCEGAWHLKEVRVLGPDEKELDLGLQNSKHLLFSVTKEEIEAQRLHDCQG